MLFWTGVDPRPPDKCLRHVWQHFPSVLEVSERVRTELRPGKVVFTAVLWVQTDGRAQQWDTCTQRTQHRSKNLEHLARDQDGKVAKANPEALPELVNVTERYVFLF